MRGRFRARRKRETLLPNRQWIPRRRRRLRYAASSAASASVADNRSGSCTSPTLPPVLSPSTLPASRLPLLPSLPTSSYLSLLPQPYFSFLSFLISLPAPIVISFCGSMKDRYGDRHESKIGIRNDKRKKHVNRRTQRNMKGRTWIASLREHLTI